MDLRVTVRALRIEAETRRRRRAEADMELRDCRVAADAELRYALMRQQVAVRRAVRCVADGAALDARGRMLEHERAALVRVAGDALLLLEAAEQRSCCGLVRIVARRALEHAFPQPVMLVQIEQRELLAVAFEADPARVGKECRSSNCRTRDAIIPWSGTTYSVRIRASVPSL